MKKIRSIIYVLGFFVLLSCSEEDDSPTPISTSPSEELKLESPNDNGVFSFGDTVHIKGFATDDETMHGYEWKIINLSNSDSIMHKHHEHKHRQRFDFGYHWVNNVNQHSDLMLEFVLFRKHSETDTIKRYFHCHSAGHGGHGNQVGHGGHQSGN